MSYLDSEKCYFGTDVKKISDDDGCTVFLLEGDSGKGTMTSYKVFPGIELIYNAFRMGEGVSNKLPLNDVVEINYCRQGRFECEFKNGDCIYLKEGDLAVNMISNFTKTACFPLQRYDGISVIIDLTIAQDPMSQILGDVSIDLKELSRKLCDNNHCLIMRATESIDHIFSELYRVPEAIRKGYFKVKILELLLFLSVICPDDLHEKRQYFNRKQVKTVKAIKEFLIENLDQNYTLEELSNQFGIAMTPMKNCFKGVYGISVFSFLRSYRMHTAAKLLREGDKSVLSVAGQVGYSNPSKFAAVFKKEMGLAPKEYKKELV